jgi:multidrug efflux pump subunit AcrA (membrane-fusion protein)
VAVDQARLALLAWREGEVVAKRNQLALALRTAEKDHRRLAEKYRKSQELRERDFISQNDLEQDEIQMIRAEAQFSQAKLDQDVYEKYTFNKDKQQKESNLKQAEEELIRVETRTAASVRSSESNLEAAMANLESKIERLARLEVQLASCTVVAPADGMVVYGTTLRGREREESLRVGSKVSRNQLLVVLPNTSRMLANVKVNEALSGHVKPDQPATVRMDAFPEQVLSGAVQSVGVLAEGGGWRDPNRRDYSVHILIDNTADLALKPSMRCKATIQIDTVIGALHVPVQSIHRDGRTTLVYVAGDGGYSAVPVTLGRSSELYVEILNGIDAEDLVLLRDPPLGMVLNAEESNP